MLRPLKKTDSKLLYDWITDKELLVFNSAYRPVSELDHDLWFESMMKRRSDIVLFVIEDSDSGKAIGSCQLMNIDPLHRSAELQIRIGDKSVQSKGFGTHSVKQLVEFGFRHLNLHRIYLHVFSNNERAIRTYIKCGFEIEGRLKEAAFIDGRYLDVIVMGILNT